ncbi:MAG: hypothetical protein KJ754_08135 [Bacteroidetes bacterium]|nr:hypothetical protein [Bacteroidota bacterium]
MIGILLFVLTGFGFSFFIKRSDKKFSMMRQFKIFFGYLLGGIALIMLIVMIVNIPKIISSERDIKEKMETRDFLIVQGKVENFVYRPERGTVFESFTVENVTFEYSEYISNYGGFPEIPDNNEPLLENGQEVRISYIEKGQEKLIMKVEVKP